MCIGPKSYSVLHPILGIYFRGVRTKKLLRHKKNGPRK